MPKPKVLLVDDDPHILESLSQLLDDGYTVYTATDGREAITFVQQTPDVAVVVSDQRMPHMKGIDVLKAIKNVSPDTIRILLTGYSDADAILDSVNVGEVFRYIKKPWNPNEMLSLLELAVSTYQRKRKAPLGQSATANNAAPLLQPSDALATAMVSLEQQRKVEEQFFDKLAQSGASSDFNELLESVFHGKSGKPKILIVDDEQGVLNALTELLSDEYDVIACRSADEALQRLEQDSFVTLLLTDQRMPKKTGTDLLIESKLHAPLVPKILITAYTDVEDIVRLINEGQIHRYIQKPWNGAKLREVIAEAVETYKLQLSMNHSATQAPKADVSPTPVAPSPSMTQAAQALQAMKALQELQKKS